MIRKTFRGFEAKSPAMIKDEKSFNLFLKRNFGASGSVSDGWKIENDLHIRVNRMGNIIIPDFSIAASDVDKWLDDAIMSLSVGRYTSKLTGDYTVVTYNNVSSRVLGRLPDGKIVLAHERPYFGYVYSLVYKMDVYSRDNIVTFPVEKDAMTEKIDKVISDYKSVLEQVKRILEERLRRWCQAHPDCDPDADYIEKYDLENESCKRRTETRSRRSFEARNSGDKSDKVLKLILSKFNEFYDELYDAEGYVEWRDEMLDLFDDYIIKECNPLIGALVNARHDVFSSDRECAAIAKTLVHFGLWPDGYPKK